MSNSHSDQATAGVSAFPHVVVFRCANGSRTGAALSSAVGRRRLGASLEWPIPVREITLPCTGKLQPEHLLKAFEAGADAVCVIACAQDNCHYLEGSRRVERRVEYVRALLDEVGLGGERLMAFHLPGSAQEDMALLLAPRESSPSTRLSEEELGSRLAAIRESVMAGLDALRPNPLRQGKATA
jgi:coenzyme F420-reducing hydrogenase delta subunit